MSYLVLARKWRPQIFEDVIGQRPITQTLQNAISQKRVAHAFLFTGARGVGKTSTARILAKALNCEAGPSINPCNQCKTCHEISSGTSIDVIEIDGASNRGIDEIRELRENVRYTPAKSRHKIFIIDEVHMLTREAFNALLKTLEEPPPHIIFVFATTEPHKIPSTILSRCQRYDFKRIPLKEIAESLKRITEEEKVQITQRGLLYLARESEGSMRDAQSLLDQVISFAGKEIRDEDIVDVLGLVDQKILHDTLEAIADRDAGRCMEVVDQVYLYGYDIQHYCRELLQSLRNLILIKVSHHPERLIELPDEELQVLRQLAERLPFDHLNHLFNLLLKGEEEVAQSTFPRTMLEMTLIRMATLRPVLAIEDILKKLEGLERTGRPSPASNIPPSFDREGPAPHGPASHGPTSEKKREFKEAGPPNESNGPKKSIEPQKRETPSEAKGEPPADSQDLAYSSGEKPGGASQKAREEAWKELVNFTRMRNPVLGAFLAFGDLIQLGDDTIEIGFEKDSFHFDRMLEAGNRSQLEKICRDYLAREAKLVISPMEQRGKSKGRVVLNIAGPTQNGQERPLEEGQGKNPLIQETLRLFNGRIVEG